MKSFWTWLRNAAGRTLVGFVPALARADDVYAESLLSPAEYRLYLQMDPRDRHHACLIAKTLCRKVPTASPELLRAALLHDVGKSAVPYRAWERIAVHIYTPGNLPPEPRVRGLRRAWQVHRFHDRYGAEMIRAAGGSERVAEIVARHRLPKGDPEAIILKEIDEVF
ncbi:MAG TPA: HD domain-containing protein [Trueperaceae bacterium]